MPKLKRMKSQEKQRRILKIRDAALAILEKHGEWVTVENFPHQVVSWKGAGFFILHRTPFQPIPTSKKLVASGVSSATQRRHAGEYGLEMWKDGKVLNIFWDVTGPIQIASYRRGPWKEELLSLTRRS